MIKLTKKFGSLNLEERLLFVATLIIPIIVFGGIFFYLSKEIYFETDKYFFPPAKTQLDISVTYGLYLPFYLIGYIIIVAILLTFSSLFLLHRKYSFAISLAILSIIIIVTRIFMVQGLLPDNQDEFAIQFVDGLFLFIISTILIWQISIPLRCVIKKFHDKISVR